MKLPVKTGHTGGRPSTARWHSVAGSKPPADSDALDVEQLENARPVVGEHSDQPIVFPLQGGSASAPPAPPSQGPGYPLHSERQPEPADGGSSALEFGTGSYAERVEGKPLVYEDVFKYPKRGSGAPQSPDGPPQAAGGSSQGSLKWGAWPFQPSRPGYWSGYPTPQRRRAKVYLPAPPSSYIIQSSNGYQRFSKTYTNVKYSPESAAAQPKGQPALQPAAPQHLQGPQRYGHSELS